jgi:hypothetical protein
MGRQLQKRPDNSESENRADRDLPRHKWANAAFSFHRSVHQPDGDPQLPCQKRKLTAAIFFVKGEHNQGEHNQGEHNQWRT